MFWQYPAYVVSVEVKAIRRRARDRTPEDVSWFAVGADDMTRNIRACWQQVRLAAPGGARARNTAITARCRGTSLEYVRKYDQPVKASLELGLNERKVIRIIVKSRVSGIKLA